MCCKLVELAGSHPHERRHNHIPGMGGFKHHWGSFAEHPPHCVQLCPRRLRDKFVDRSRFLSGSLLENLFALPRRGEGASPPFWLLLSAPALSQHCVSSSQSPCQQDFTQWAGELQSIAQANTHTHTHAGAHYSLQTRLLYSPNRLINKHL